jgi:5'(3')-deoxyribonucleotidase
VVRRHASFAHASPGRIWRAAYLGRRLEPAGGYMSRILVDMDGVLAETLSPWLAEYRRLTGDMVFPADIKSYSFESYVHYPKVLLSALSHEVFVNALPERCAIGGVERLLAAGHEVRIVTYVLGETRNGYEQKLRWLANWMPQIKPEWVIFCASREKQFVSGDILIEDRPQTIEEWCAKDIDRRAFLIDQSYNKDFTHTHCERVSSVARVADILEQESKR